MNKGSIARRKTEFENRLKNDSFAPNSYEQQKEKEKDEPIEKGNELGRI